MIDRIKKAFTGFGQVCGINAHIRAGEVCWSYILLKKEKGQLKISASGTDPDPKVLADLPQEVPVFLNITGKGMLVKKLEGSPGENSIEGMIPEQDRNAFFFQEISAGIEQYGFLIRQEKVNELIAAVPFPARIISISLGVYQVYGLLSVFGLQSVPVPDADARITGESLKLSDPQGSDVISLSGMDIRRNLTPVLADILSYFLSGEYTSGINYPALEDNFERVFYGNLTKTAGVGILALTLALVLCNLCFFLNWSSENDRLKAEMQVYSGQIEEIERLTGKVERQRAFLNSAGWNTDSRVSFYSDRIASTVPHSVSLELLEVNPLDQAEHRKNNIYRFGNGVIKIKGSCTEPLDLHKWINELKKFEWISEVENTGYSLNQETGSGMFYLKIKVSG